MQPKEIEKNLDTFLLKVQKPGRYAGGEYNAVMKDLSTVETRIALAFPDIYDLGVPNLGLSIFYDQLNKIENVWAERVYLPWEDMEAEMRSRGIPLYTLESKTQIMDMDVLGITIPYESLYTNVLTLLDLAQIPLFSAERDERHPLVIAGGHATYNPEPMAPFIDVFAIGEGEELFPEMINCYQDWKRSGESRIQLLERLSQIEGVYIPSFYEPSYNENGTLAEIKPIHAGAKPRIKKRIVPVLPEPPEKFIVPSIDVVQNRVAVEIMRGCSRGCRFCQAGFITRPVRERPADMIVRSLNAALEDTGYEEAALLSLSSSDYRPIRELVTELHDLYQKRRLNIALPSLRIDTVSVDILEQLRGSRAGGFTLAPEAASEKIKTTINKYITEEQLLHTAEVIYGRGWTTIKLYFMIGLPNETMEDVQAIADLAIKVIKIGRRLVGKRSQLNLGIATFVPKPHTPFQWAQLDDPEIVAEKQALLKKELKTPGVKISWSEPDSTMFEAWSTRGDRRMSSVIYRAWQLGAKLDAWADHYRKDAWMQAFAENDLSPEFYVHRKREADEVFPWDIIDIGVNKRTLRREYENSLNGVLRPDCRTGCYGCGIVQAFQDFQPEEESVRWFCPLPEKG